MAKTNIDEINRTVEVLVKETRWKTALGVLNTAIASLPPDRRIDLDYLESLKEYVLTKKDAMAQQDRLAVDRMNAEIDRKTERVKALTAKMHGRQKNLNAFVYIGMAAAGAVFGLYIVLKTVGDLSPLERTLANFIRDCNGYWLYDLGACVNLIGDTVPAVNSCFNCVALFACTVFAVSLLIYLCAKFIRACRQSHNYRKLTNANNELRELVSRRNGLIDK